MTELKFTFGLLVAILQVDFLLSIHSDILLNILQPFQIFTKGIASVNHEIDLEIVLGIDAPIIPAEFTLGSSVSFLGNIRQVVNMDFENEHSKSVAVLLSTNESSFFANLQQISETFHDNLKNWRPYWFLCYPNEISPKVLETVKTTILKSQMDSLENKSAPLDGDFYLVFHISDGIKKNLSIWEVYNVKNRSILHEIKFENLSNMDFIVNISRKVSRRNDFQGITFIGTAGYDEDYPFETEFAVNSNTTFKSGLAVSLYRDLKDTLNFSEAALPGKWMLKNESESIDWLVINGFADIAISQTTLTLDTRPDTNASLTFIQPTSSARLYAILVQPPASTIRNIFVSPFSSSLWFGLASTLLIIIFTTIAIARIKQRAGHWDPGAENLSEQATVWVLGTFCQQGYWHQSPMSASMKTVFMTSATAGMVCYIAYSAAIVSTLTNKVIPIRNVVDLKSSHLTIYGDLNDALSDYVFEGWVNVSNPKSTISPEEGLSVLTKSSSAFLGFTDAFVGVARRINFTSEKCMCEKFSYLPFSRVDYKSSMFIKRGSPLREFFNNKVISLKERGLNKKYMDTYNRFANLQCAAESATEKKSLGLNDVFTSFAILVTAYLFCAAILVFEKVGSISGSTFEFDSFSVDNRVVSLENIVTSGKTEVSMFTVRSEPFTRVATANRRASL